MSTVGSIAVVGAGVGGLAAALALHQAGHRVEVFEQAADFQTIGAGISLFPNAVRALESLGVSGSLTDRRRARDVEIRNGSGRRLVATRLDPDTAPLVLRRPELIDLLRSPLNCPLHTGIHVTRVTESGLIELDGGSTRRFDLVVLADGVASSNRARLWPATKVRSTGIRAWRWIVENADPGFSGELLGRGGQAGILPLADGGTYVFAASRTLEHLQDFTHWSEPLPSLIAAADPASIHADELVELRPPRSFVRGRAVLLGDAAHAMRPHLAQGAATALEDAVELAHWLPDLAAYDRRRVRRTRVIHRTARLVSQPLSVSGRPTVALRDLGLWAVPDRLATLPLRLFSGWRPPAED